MPNINIIQQKRKQPSEQMQSLSLEVKDRAEEEIEEEIKASKEMEEVKETEIQKIQTQKNQTQAKIEEEEQIILDQDLAGQVLAKEELGREDETQFYLEIIDFQISLIFGQI